MATRFGSRLDDVARAPFPFAGCRATGDPLACSDAILDGQPGAAIRHGAAAFPAPR